MIFLKQRNNISYITLLIGIILITTSVSCRNRYNPGLNEKDLVEKIEADSVIVENAIEEFDFSPDSTLVHHNLNEKRIITSNKPIVIDLTSNAQSKEFKLSDIGESIECVKLSHPDSLYFITGTTQVFFTKELFITHNLRGISAFRKDGSFIDYIVKNEVEIFAIGRSFGYGMSDLKGVISSPSVRNNQLLYVYTNVPEKYKILYSLNLNQINKRDSSEEFNKGIQLKKYKGSISGGISSFTYLSNDILLGFNSFWNSIQSNELFYSFNQTGDTLCTFENYDKVDNFGFRSYQMAESGNIYRFNSDLKYRQAYNDTLYKIISENRLEPEYILYRGDKGVTTQEGMTPGSDLKGKILINQLYETKKWFLIVTCDNQNSPNNKKAGVVGFKYWFYNKNTNQLYVRSGEYENEYEQLKNDLDSGLGFWPTDVGSNGNLISTTPVKYLMEDYPLEKLKKSFPFIEFSNNELIITILK